MIKRPVTVASAHASLLSISAVGRALVATVLAMLLMGVSIAVSQTLPFSAPDTLARTSQSIIVRVRPRYIDPKRNTQGPSSATASNQAQFLSLAAGLGVSLVKPLWRGDAFTLAASAQSHPGAQTFVVEVPGGRSADELAAQFAQQLWVEYAEVDGLVSLHSEPNDSLWTRQWDLHNTGQPYLSVRGVEGNDNDTLIERVGDAGADIRFLAAHETADPVADVLVGVIDTGLDTTHADLREQLVHNPGEIPLNGIDDDHNGFIDDVLGWDFSGDDLLAPNDIIGDNDITDFMGHGTHVAGTIAATVNNGVGITGVCTHAHVIGVKIFPNPFFSISAEGIYYAVDRGVRVINMSWGGAFRSRAIEDALQYAHDRGVVLVASMGNSGRNEVLYPSGYSTTIGVGATDAKDHLARFSTFNDSIDVSAPGVDILSLRAAGTDLYADVGEPGVHIVDSNYFIASGTSMSSPHVAGAAAVLLSFAPGLSNERVREILEASADDIRDPYGNDSLDLPGMDQFTGAGRINLERALTMLPGVLVSVTSHSRGAMLSGEDTVISGRAAGRNFSGLSAQLAYNHPPLATTWIPISPDKIAIVDGTFRILLPEADTLSGPYTVRIGAGTDAVLDWPLWFGGTAIAQIDSPLDEDTIQLLRPIVGTAFAPGFRSYSLTALGPLPSHADHPIFSSSVICWNDTLAYWRTDSLDNGDYELVLTVQSRDGLSADTTRVSVHDAFLSGFPVYLPTPAHLAVATVNLDGVPGEEIVCPTEDGLYVLQSNGQVYPGWPRATDFDVSTAPAIADLDHDGKNEIIVASRSFMHVYAFIGEPFAGWPQVFLGGSGIFGNSVPLVGDFDGTGGLEVASIDRHGRIQVWHADGTTYAPQGGQYFARIEIDHTLNSSIPQLALCDLNHDGRMEMVAAGDGIYLFDALTGNAMAGNESTLLASYYSSHGLVVGDYNGDSRFDIAYVAVETLSGRFSLHVIDSHGVPLPGWPREIPLTVHDYLQYSLSAGDVDGDHIPELMFAPYSLGDGYLYAFHGNGVPVGSDSTNGLLAALPGSVSAVTITNIDRDDAPEIVMRVGDLISGPDRIYALKSDGELVPGYPITFGDGNASTVPAPIIGDVNADGIADMTTVQSTSTSVAVWNLGVPATTKGRLWPRISGDLWNSNVAASPRFDVIYLVRLIDMIFRNGRQFPPYEPSDIDCDGVSTMTDVVTLTNYLFARGTVPCRP